MMVKDGKDVIRVQVGFEGSSLTKAKLGDQSRHDILSLESDPHQVHRTSLTSGEGTYIFHVHTKSRVNVGPQVRLDSHPP